MPQQLIGGPVVATWPGGIGNPVGEQIPTSGGGKRRNTRKNRRNRRSTRKNRRTTRR